MTQHQCFEGPGDTCRYHDCPLIAKRIASQMHGHPPMIWMVCPVTEALIKVRN
jgi:hypothetical protein